MGLAVRGGHLSEQAPDYTVWYPKLLEEGILVYLRER